VERCRKIKYELGVKLTPATLRKYYAKSGIKFVKAVPFKKRKLIMGKELDNLRMKYALKIT